PQEEASDETVRPPGPGGGAGSTLCGFGTALLVDITPTSQALFIFPACIDRVSVVLLVRRRPLRPT
ncbi:MAG: hypothetical protein WCC01_10130, partial [Acidimicrobiia bacterium]